MGDFGVFFFLLIFFGGVLSSSSSSGSNGEKIRYEAQSFETELIVFFWALLLLNRCSVLGVRCQT